MSFVNGIIETTKARVGLQVLAGLFISVLSLIVFLILHNQGLTLEQKSEYLTEIITISSAILGLLVISFNTYYIRMLAKEIQEKYNNPGNGFSSAKLQLLEKLIENQDIQIEVSYGDTLEEKSTPQGFYQAIEQLGSEKTETRLGAIYNLEQIAKDSPDKHWTIIEILAAYVRENAPAIVSDEESDADLELSVLPTDIQAALTAIARRDVSKEPKNQKLDLRFIDIRGADLSGANLQGADFTGADLREVILYGANLEAADFSGVNLQEVVMYEANLQEALFYEANLQGAVLRKANLSKAVFYEANLHAAILYDAQLPEAVFYQAILQSANLCDANLKDASLEGCHLIGANLIGANLQGANLIGANLQNVSFSTANLQEAILYEAILSKANLCDANLSKANLVGANLIGAILQETNLCGVDLSRAENLQQQQIELAVGDSATILPEHLKAPSHWV